MSKKTYVITSNISVRPANGADKLGLGDEIKLSAEDAEALLGAGYIAEKAPAKAKAPEGQSRDDGPPATLKPVAGRDEVREIPGTKETVTAGQLLAEAYASSGLNVKGWNAQSDEEIAARLDAALAALAASALA